MRIVKNVKRSGFPKSNNGARSFSRWVFVIVACLSFSGCRSVDLGIVDVQTRALIKIPCSGGSKPQVMAVNDDASEFVTLIAQGEEAGLRVYGYDGQEKRFLFPKCLQKNSDIISSSGDGSKLVFRNPKNSNLYVYNTETDVETLVYSNISSATQWDSIAGIAWLSKEKLLVLLNKDYKKEREHSVIEVVDITSKERKVLFSPRYIHPFCNAYAISADKTKIAFCDGESNDSVVRILEIETGKVLYSGKKGAYRNIQWLQTGIGIGYVSGGHKIDVVSLADKTEYTLLTISQKYTIMHLGFGKDFFAVDVWRFGERNDQIVVPMNIYDLKTREEVFTVRADVRGNWFVADHGQKIICEIGY